MGNSKVSAAAAAAAAAAVVAVAAAAAAAAQSSPLASSRFGSDILIGGRFSRMRRFAIFPILTVSFLNICRYVKAVSLVGENFFARVQETGSCSKCEIVLLRLEKGSSGVHEQPTLVCLQDSNIKNSTVGGDKNGDNKKHTGRRATSGGRTFTVSSSSESCWDRVETALDTLIWASPSVLNLFQQEASQATIKIHIDE
ncbi:LOW QUALITY PROTEIN: hypothetical protein V1477_006970 [Vespula maculifrons]|uniref:Uncharacterized protein n=1 Tax=Vespula maculifrons TaxID=7453 RepID=A0ABD2CH72_VESMC